MAADQEEAAANFPKQDNKMLDMLVFSLIREFSCCNRVPSPTSSGWEKDITPPQSTLKHSGKTSATLR
jgi:hypothetical protein